MDASQFDALSKTIAGRPNRRRLLGLAGALGFGSLLYQRTAQPAAAAKFVCKGASEKCESGKCRICSFDEDGKGCTCWCGTCVGSGITGGGAITSADGEAHVSIIATRAAVPNQPGVFAVQGQVLWTDPAWEGKGLALESHVVSFYGPLPDVEGGRQAAGWLTSDRYDGAFPFVLTATDAGGPGSGKDTVAIWVGDAVVDDAKLAAMFEELESTGFQYAAEGALIAGDFQLLQLSSETEETAPTE